MVRVFLLLVGFNGGYCVFLTGHSRVYPDIRGMYELVNARITEVNLIDLE